MDQIVRAIAGDGMIKAAGISARDMVEHARQAHKTLPLATAALGRALMGVSIMGDMMKEEQASVTMQIKGGGPLGTIVVVSDSQGNTRGYVQNGETELLEKEPGKLDVGAGVGCDGTLTVIRDLNMKEPYVGSIQLVSGEIADDISAYFVESEQIPTACALGVLVDTDQSVTAAGGYLIQLLPGADEDLISRLEGNIMKVGHATNTLKQGKTAADLLRAVLEGFEPQILEEHPVEYRCYCSRERVVRALVSMGREELFSMIEEQGGAQLTCQFCDKVYSFTKEELEALLENM